MPLTDSKPQDQIKSTAASYWLAGLLGTMLLLAATYLGAYALIVEPYYISSGPAQPRYDHKTSRLDYSAFDVRCEKLFRPAHWIDRNLVRREMWRKDSFEHARDVAAGRTR